MKTRLPLISLLLAGAFGLTACQPQPSIATLPAGERAATLWITPTLVQDSAVQAHVDELDASDVARLEIIPYWHPEGESPRPLSPSGEPTDPEADAILKLTLSGEQLAQSRAIALSGLRRRQTYSLVAHAYSASGLRISEPLLSTVQVNVFDDDRPAMPTVLPVKLLATPFAGRLPIELDLHDPTDRASFLELTLVAASGGAEYAVAAPELIPTESLPRTITLKNLAALTAYRLVVTARGADPTAAPLSVTEVTWRTEADDELELRRVVVEVPAEGG